MPDAGRVPRRDGDEPARGQAAGHAPVPFRHGHRRRLRHRRLPRRAGRRAPAGRAADGREGRRAARDRRCAGGAHARDPRGQRARPGGRARGGAVRRAARPPAARRRPRGRDRRAGRATSPRCRTRSARSSTASGCPTASTSPRCATPLGVVAVVYEARPNVTIDAAALCLKSGNAIVLRGSSSAAHSNAVLARDRRPSSAPEGAIGLVAGGGREELAELATQDELVDLIIPRGGEGLKKALIEVATVPMIFAASGNCHVYVDARRRPRRGARDHHQRQDPAARACATRPRRCSCTRDVADAFLPGALARAARRGRRAARRRRACARSTPTVARGATDADWDTEFLALILAVGVVDSVDEAIDHVNRHGSGHSEAIVTALLRGRARLRARRRRGLRLRQRLDALHRRRRVRLRRRDRQLHPEAARPRADRPARAVLVQVRRARATGTSAPDGVARVGRPRRDLQPAARRAPAVRAGGHDQLGLDRVLLMPVAAPPHKEAPDDPGPAARLAMCELAVGGDERFAVSRPGGSSRWSVLHGRYPAGTACDASREPS